MCAACYESVPLRLSKLHHLYGVCLFLCVADKERSPISFDSTRYVQYVLVFIHSSRWLLRLWNYCERQQESHHGIRLSDLTLITQHANSGAVCDQVRN